MENLPASRRRIDWVLVFLALAIALAAAANVYLFKPFAPLSFGAFPV